VIVRRSGLALAVVAVLTAACDWSNVSPFVSQKVPSNPVVALTHVRVIDGTGNPSRDDQTVVIGNGRITAVGPASETRIPDGAATLDLRDRTVFPGLVGMHDHLYYYVGNPFNTVTPQETFAQLYLGSGVTTIRTGGAIEFEGDLRLKRLIDRGTRVGPTIYLSSPYLHAASAIPEPERIKRDVNTWADQGVTSIKAYKTLRAEELKAAVDAAHARGLKVMGHICAVGYQDAADLGIDNIEHGLVEDSEFTPGKPKDVCPDEWAMRSAILGVEIESPAVQRLISRLVRRGVAITSTLAVLESFTTRPQLDVRAIHILTPKLTEAYRSTQARLTSDRQTSAWWDRLLRKEMEFERAFFAAGGRLVAGVDATGWGGVAPGFGNQRQIELLVDAGFKPEVAIRIATANGAALLNDTNIGFVTPGLQADLVVVNGNPSAKIADIRNVEIVFRKGVAYDPEALITSTYGTIGRFEMWRLVRWPYGPIMGGLLVLLVLRRVSRRFLPARR
jgi:imidazolonepropionase-like amidohydrolase